MAIDASGRIPDWLQFLSASFALSSSGGLATSSIEVPGLEIDTGPETKKRLELSFQWLPLASHLSILVFCLQKLSRTLLGCPVIFGLRNIMFCSPLLLLLSCGVRLFVTPWCTAHRTSLSFTISQSLLKLMSTESVMPSNHLILCCPLLLLIISTSFCKPSPLSCLSNPAYHYVNCSASKFHPHKPLLIVKHHHLASRALWRREGYHPPGY